MDHSLRPSLLLKIMGHWSARQLRGGGGVSSIITQAPVLQVTGGDTLEWEWPFANPFEWRIEISLDGVSEWDTADEINGADRAWPDPSPSLDRFFRVVGINNTGNQVTGHSNVIEISP